VDYKILSELNIKLSERKEMLVNFLTFLSKRTEFKECGIKFESRGFSFWGYEFEFSFMYGGKDQNYFYLQRVFYDEDNKLKNDKIIKFQIDLSSDSVHIVNGRVVEYSLINIKNASDNPENKNAATFVNGIIRKLIRYLKEKSYKVF